LICSATSVDVEEQLYRVARDMGVTFITSSQVSFFSIHSLVVTMKPHQSS